MNDGEREEEATFFPREKRRRCSEFIFSPQIGLVFKTWSPHPKKGIVPFLKKYSHDCTTKWKRKSHKRRRRNNNLVFVANGACSKEEGKCQMMFLSLSVSLLSSPVPSPPRDIINETYLRSSVCVWSGGGQRKRKYCKNNLTPKKRRRKFAR